MYLTYLTVTNIIKLVINLFIFYFFSVLQNFGHFGLLSLIFGIIGILLIIIGGIFVIESVSVIIQVLYFNYKMTYKKVIPNENISDFSGLKSISFTLSI